MSQASELPLLRSTRALVWWLVLLLIASACGEGTRSELIGTWEQLDEGYSLMYVFPSGDIQFAIGLPVDSQRSRPVVNVDWGRWMIDGVGRLCFTKRLVPAGCGEPETERASGTTVLRIYSDADTFSFRRLSGAPDTACWRIELADSLMAGLVKRQRC